LNFPANKTITPQIFRGIKANIPSLTPPTEVNAQYGADFEDYAIDIHEWISMVLLTSPRIDPDDRIDPFLSRYIPPGDSPKSGKLVKIIWRGFMPSSWANKGFVEFLQTIPRDAWFAYSIDGFGGGSLSGGKNCTILKLPSSPKEYVMWEIM
jgi:ribonuclease P/MRP protein subunit RPP40